MPKNNENRGFPCATMIFFQHGYPWNKQKTQAPKHTCEGFFS